MPRANIAPDLGLPIALDRASQTPMHQQLCEQLRRAILDGRLSRGGAAPIDTDISTGDWRLTHGNELRL